MILSTTIASILVICTIILILVSLLLLASSKYIFSFSIPKYDLPNFFETTAVVPDPKKGSRIRSSLFEVAYIIL